MSLNKDKYTVYQIEQLTKGKLSKYKLTKAIENGELKAEKVNDSKRGRGIPNYWVKEDDLKQYLKAIEEANKKFKDIDYAGNSEDIYDNNTDLTTLISQNIECIKTQSETIDGLQNRILMLEKASAKVVPLLEEIQYSQERSVKRKEIVMELANISPLQTEKRNQLLQELNKLA